VGRAAAVIDKPAWSMIGYAEALVISLAVLVGFLMWRGLVKPPVALVLAVVPPWVFGQPRKSYEILIFALFLPWILRTFLGRPREAGGLHWLLAGLIGGLIVQTYQGPLVLSGLGIAAIIVVTFRGAANRAGYARHVALTAVTAFVVSAWYLVPYLHATVTIGGSLVSDFFVSPSVADDPLGVDFLTFLVNPPGLREVLQLVGLFGLVWYWRTAWWARPMLLLVIGTYVYRWAGLLLLAGTGHTAFLQYTIRVGGIILACGGVLTIVTAAPGLGRRLTLRPHREVVVLATATVLIIAGLSGVLVWMPQPAGLNDVQRPGETLSANLVAYAHAEQLPNGARTRFAAKGVTVPWFPAEPARDAIRRTLGPEARPVTLSPDERFFAYYPYPGYVAVARDAANSWTHFDERVAELGRLASIRDPAEFARASRNTRFGEIDVFILRAGPNAWTAVGTRFDPAQFGGAYWDITSLANGYVVAVRRP
jgi:hypothetical protein